MFRKLFLIVLSIYSCHGVIYHLNENEYYLMPPLYGLDDYEACLREPGGTFCLADVDLYSHTPSELMDMIKEYSAHTMKHFNYTQIHRGICITKTCQNFIQNHSISTKEGQNAILDACLNDSLWKHYKIQGKLANLLYCNREGDRIIITTGDIIMAAVCLVIIILNAVGSLYDILMCKDSKSGNQYFLAFSVKRNWRKLVGPSGSVSEPRIERLKVFHGMRTLTMCCVIFSHTTLISVHAYIDNPEFVEQGYDNLLMQLLLNGNLVTQIFLVMSSFLLAYYFQLHNEEHGISWWLWPKGVMLRWFRLTPLYGLILAAIITWIPHAGKGPMWDLVVTSEAEACSQYWWSHVLYINNYIYDNGICAPPTWYLAADTQLFYAGLLFCVVVRGSRARKVCLMLLLVLAIAIVASHTYFQDLNAIIIQSPETLRTLYAYDDTYRLVYVRGHTNMSSYVLGLAGGFIAYRWQKDGKDWKQYRKFRILYWLMLPVGLGIILSGIVFYVDGSPPSTVLRVLYAASYKTVFQILLVVFIIGAILKYEKVYRLILGWRGFTWMGRVTYGAFLLHFSIIRVTVGLQTRPIHMTNHYVAMLLISTFCLSYGLAVVLFLLIETPVGGLMKALLVPKKPEPEKSPETTFSHEVEPNDKIQYRL